MTRHLRGDRALPSGASIRRQPLFSRGGGGLGVWGGCLALPLALPLALALGLVWASGGSSSLLSKWRGLFLGALGGGLGFGALGGGVVLSPLVVVVLLLRLVYPARSCTLTQPLCYGSMSPALLPASHLPNLCSTERAKLGSFPNILHNSVTPTRCVRPPPSRHSTRSPRGSAPHVCTLVT